MAGMEPASIGYRYRRFTLSDKVTHCCSLQSPMPRDLTLVSWSRVQINLVARTSVNALYEEKGKDTAFLTVRVRVSL